MGRSAAISTPFCHEEGRVAGQNEAAIDARLARPVPEWPENAGPPSVVPSFRHSVAAPRRRSGARSGSPPPPRPRAAPASDIALSVTTTSVTSGRAYRERPRLVHDDGLHAGHPLQRFAALDEEAVLGAAAGRHHHGRGHREAHGAGAGDDQHGDTHGKRAHGGLIRAEPPPDQERHERRSPCTAGTKTAEIRSARAWIGALEPCASSTMRMIRDSTVSRPTRVTRKTRDPLPLSVPPVTAIARRP